ncbi:MAG: hypothetical protein AAGE52_10800 [Myxococcota bacterium]
MLTFDHHWTLSAAGEGTRVVQHEYYRGIGVWFWDPSWYEDAYERAIEGLGRRVLELRAEAHGRSPAKVAPQNFSQ